MLISAGYTHLPADTCTNYAKNIRSEMGKSPWGIDSVQTKKYMQELTNLNNNHRPKNQTSTQSKTNTTPSIKPKKSSTKKKIIVKTSKNGSIKKKVIVKNR